MTVYARPIKTTKETFTKSILVTIATLKLDDLAYFLIFCWSQTRGWKADAPDMGHVIHKIDRLINPYRKHNINIDKIILITMATKKLDDFAYFWVFLGSHIRV